MSMNSRSEYVKKNIMWGNIGNIVCSLISFISRTIFIYSLGSTYLGINGLFSNVLGLLSFTELGIGSAMNYSLYKPISENDTEKIKSLMNLYKIAYRWIAIIIGILGLILLPYINVLVNTDIEYPHLKIYFLIFLFNTVSSYFVTYKYAYVNSIQKGYILTNINTIATVLLQIIQIIILIFSNSFMIYLLAQALLGIIQKIITVIYINRHYLILTEKDIKPLDEKTKTNIIKDVKALVIHKIGDASVHQTDNIVISLFVNTKSVGLISNYIMLNTMIAKFTDTIFNSFSAGLGNLVATESLDKQKKILDLYNFIGFWIYGFVVTAFITLVQPFISIWIGADMKVDNLTMVLYFITIYLAGQSLTIYNFKVAAGIFNEDKWVAFVQAIVNLVISIMAVKIIGLPGVYIGTIVQRSIVIVIRPLIVYKNHFKNFTIEYFVKFIWNGISVIIACFIMVIISNSINFQNSMMNFMVLMFLTLIIPNLVFLITHFKSKELVEVVIRIKMKKSRN